MKPARLLAAVFGLALVVPAFADTPITPVPVGANFRVAAVQVRVALDHRDWHYQLGETAKFRIHVLADNEPIDNASVSYLVGPEGMPGETKTAAVPLDGLVVEGTMKAAGFLRCTARAQVAGREYRGAATAAFAPEQIQPTQVEPADFDAFWKAQLAELTKKPMAPMVTPMPEEGTDTVDVYHVSFVTVGENWRKTPVRFYGILCEPKAPGKYPAVLRVPGAGVRPYRGDKDLAARGVITLEIGVHGIPVNLPPAIYEALAYGALNDYPVYQLDNKEAFYYRRIYVSCVRANDFLTSREKWNGKDLLVAGGSQGGQLAIVTAALDSRVTGLCSTHPAWCDVTGWLHGRAGGWPHMFRPDGETGKPSPHISPAKIETTSYYDTVNFAKRIRVPGYYTWGYNDDVCPPTTVYAAYNQIKAPKTLGLTLELAHASIPEQQEAITAWIVKQLGLK